MSEGRTPPPLFVRWTPYGRWSDDGSHVINARTGLQIYEVTDLEARDEREVGA